MQQRNRKGNIHCETKVQNDRKNYNLNYLFKGIVSRDFEGLQMILMNRSWVPDVPLVVCYFLNFRFHIHVVISSKF